MDTTIAPEDFFNAAKEFCKISDKICDGWKFIENKENLHKSYLQKDTFIEYGDGDKVLFKAEYIVFYNLSYGVPSFSFNIWKSSGILLTLEDIRQMPVVMLVCLLSIWTNIEFLIHFALSLYTRIKKEDFYSVITQQEHPLFQRPYFVMHPCHTETLLSAFRKSKNIIVTFLGLITPLIKLKLPMEYGLQ